MKFRKNHFINQKGSTQVKKSDGKGYTVRDNRERYFFPDEWKAFYDSLNKRRDKKPSPQQVTFNTLINTGARINEIRNVKVHDIDTERGNVILRVTKRVVNRPGVDKKGKRNIRVVTVSSQYIKFLKKVIRDYQLKDEDTLPIITTQGANKALKQKLKSIGVEDWDMFSLHNIRKTTENWLLALGVNWNKVIKQFGHSANVSLKHYLSGDLFSFEEKKEIAEILGDLKDKMKGEF